MSISIYFVVDFFLSLVLTTLSIFNDPILQNKKKPPVLREGDYKTCLHLLIETDIPVELWIVWVNGISKNWDLGY